MDAYWPGEAYSPVPSSNTGNFQLWATSWQVVPWEPPWWEPAQHTKQGHAYVYVHATTFLADAAGDLLELWSLAWARLCYISAYCCCIANFISSAICPNGLATLWKGHERRGAGRAWLLAIGGDSRGGKWSTRAGPACIITIPHYVQASYFSFYRSRLYLRKVTDFSPWTLWAQRCWAGWICLISILSFGSV
jgi:hypothetical protein